MLEVHGATVDDLLGNRNDRYFGAGYSKVESQLEDIVISTPQDLSTARRLQGRAHIRFPDEWSNKGGYEQRPHLSTIDAVALSWGAARALAGERGPGRITKLTFMPGSHPVEGNPIHVTVSAEQHLSDTEGTTVHVNIDRTRVVLECSPQEAMPSDLPGDIDELNFKKGFLEISPLASRDDGQTVVADVRRRGVPDAQITLVDAFASVLQLGQVLLYQLDAVHRKSSNTLWLRRAVFTRQSEGGAGEQTSCRVFLASTSLVPRGDALWRSARIVGTVGGVSVEASVAHRLPEGTVGAKTTRL